MGYFGTFLYEQGQWTEVNQQLDAPSNRVQPWLMVDIHDSDFTAVTYRPSGTGTGTAFLGVTPRTYFDDETASAPTDVPREAAGLSGWWQLVRGGASDTERTAKAAELTAYLAEDLDPSVFLEDDEETVDDDVDDADIFVEVKTVRFLEALDLPLPERLAS